MGFAVKTTKYAEDAGLSMNTYKTSLQISREVKISHKGVMSHISSISAKDPEFRRQAVFGEIISKTGKPTKGYSLTKDAVHKLLRIKSKGDTGFANFYSNMQAKEQRMTSSIYEKETDVIVEMINDEHRKSDLGRTTELVNVLSTRVGDDIAAEFDFISKTFHRIQRKVLKEAL